VSEDTSKSHAEYISDEKPVAVSSVPQNKPKDQSALSNAVMVQAQFSGPLPPPAILEHYDQIQPGAANRIICMAEEQSAHRRAIEKLIVQAEASSQRLGPILGFIIAMTVIIGGMWLIANGREIGGLVAVLTALGALVGVFVYGKYQQQKELERESGQRSKQKKPKNRRK